MSQRIDGIITRPDGQKVHFQITRRGSSQWGLASWELGATVDLLGAMTEAVENNGFLRDPEPERPPAPNRLQLAVLRGKVTRLRKAAETDTADERLEALGGALHEALGLLGIAEEES